MQQAFEEAVARVKTLPAQPNQVLLDLYGLYKQATQGDVTGSAPGMFDLKGQAKHKAWASHRGQSRDEAMQAYIDLVGRLAHG